MKFNELDPNKLYDMYSSTNVHKNSHHLYTVSIDGKLRAIDRKDFEDTGSMRTAKISTLNEICNHFNYVEYVPRFTFEQALKQMTAGKHMRDEAGFVYYIDKDTKDLKVYSLLEDDIPETVPYNTMILDRISKEVFYVD